MATYSILYHFEFENKRNLDFAVELDSETLDPVSPLPETLPSWTALKNHQCENCPLQVETHPHCPLSARIVNIIDGFGEITSFDDVVVTVETPERTITKKTTAQNGASALLGLVMATSGCPLTSFFKPMAAYHLPLASADETVYRAASMYLLAQYYVKQRGGVADLNLDGLREIYENIEILNKDMANRVKAAIRNDAAVNAIVILDFFAKNVTAILEPKLADLAPLFDVYLEQLHGQDSGGG